MKISKNWLLEYVKLPISMNKLADLFNIHSAEVEDEYNLVNASNLVIGYVTDIKKHPDADKLSICQVDIGQHESQIICGAPNVDKGQHVIVALPGAVLPGNFKIKKATIRGVESNGMICSLSELGIDKKFHNEDGIHVIDTTVTPGENALQSLYLDDEIMDIDITPNRADLLSMMGVAYDVSAILNTELHFPTPSFTESNTTNDVTIELDTTKCLSYYARVLDDLEVKASPLWMRQRLIAAGMRPINNVVDIANYVMLETGQPLHTFDYDLLDSSLIKVRQATKDETLITLDDQTRTLSTSDIVITDGKQPIALGGVMGGNDTEIHKDSSSLLLESAVFDPISIRKTSSRLDLRSEASIRFERKIDPKRTILALERATDLFVKYANATVRKGISVVDNTKANRPIIDITVETINSNLGSSYDETVIEDAFDRLRFDYTKDNYGYHVTLPSRRQDMEGYQDIIEEVGRIIGYDTLPATLPTTVSMGGLSPVQQFERLIKDTLTTLGLTEAITYSLVSDEDAYNFVNKEQPLIHLQRPMSSDKNVLTLTPINGLVDVVKHNVARKIKDVQLFELGKRYEKEQETKLLAGALTGEYSSTKWNRHVQTIDFFTVKGILMSLFDALSLSHLTFKAIDGYNNLHPGQTAAILNRNEKVGFIGKLHPKYEQDNDIEDVFVFELNVMKLFDARRPLRSVKAINKYPTVTRDLALVMKRDISAKQAIDVITKQGKRMLQDVEIFDLYQGEHIDSNKKSLAIRLAFSNNDKTLDSNEVDERVNVILHALKRELDIILRS